MAGERFPSPWHRRMDRLLRALGYTRRPGRTGGHIVYTHPEQPMLKIASTPRNEHATQDALLRALRHRHPDVAGLAPRVHNRGRVRGPRRLRVVALARPPRQTEARPRPACGDCGRVWLSDLDPTFRACPACGGVVLGSTVGRAA